MAGTLALTVNGRAGEVEVQEHGGVTRVRLGDHWHTAELLKTNRSGLYSLLIDGRSWELFARERPGGFDLLLGNHVYEVTVGRPRRADAVDETSGAWTLVSPLSGLVTEVRVRQGDSVQAGQPLLVVESMKMNNELSAVRAGTVTEVHVTPGERVERGRLLLQIA
jgi:acetyl/propionyl-CoA carboxylase alpha subunit